MLEIRVPAADAGVARPGKVRARRIERVQTHVLVINVVGVAWYLPRAKVVQNGNPIPGTVGKQRVRIEVPGNFDAITSPRIRSWVWREDSEIDTRRPS